MSRLLQISDLHLLADPNEARWGLNPQALFNEVLALGLTQRPDAIVLSGDLVHDESETGYQRLAQQIAATGLPSVAIAGNHDNPALIRHYFDQQLELPDCLLMGLDSHVQGSDCGFLGTDELNRLKLQLKQQSKALIVSIHHPPLAVGSRWIDELCLADADDFISLLQQPCYASVAAVLCGHVHQVFSSHINQIPVLTCPSSNRQFLPGAVEFSTDDKPPGCRIVDIDNGCINSQILRLAR